MSTTYPRLPEKKSTTHLRLSLPAKKTFITMMPVAILIGSVIPLKSLAQVPVITYSTPNVLHINQATSAIVPVNAGGAVIDQTFTLNSSFSNPGGIAMDGSGNIYVADKGNN